MITSSGGTVAGVSAGVALLYTISGAGGVSSCAKPVTISAMRFHAVKHADIPD
jgi:hypothetical protein